MRRLRPWFLVASLIVTWLMGMYGMTAGCDTVSYLRSGSIPDEAAVVEQAKVTNDKVEAFRLLANAAHKQAVAEARARTFPLGVAHIILCLLLVAGSALALAGRPGSDRFMTQAIVANVALALVDYALTKQMRASYVANLTRTASELSFVETRTFAMQARLMDAINLVVRDLVPLAVAFLALRTKRARVFFETVARAQENQLDDEDDL